MCVCELECRQGKRVGERRETLLHVLQYLQYSLLQGIDLDRAVDLLIVYMLETV